MFPGNQMHWYWQHKITITEKYQDPQNIKNTKITQNKQKKLKTSRVPSYELRPGSGEGLFLFQHFINLSLTYLHLPTYLQSGAKWQESGAMVKVHLWAGNETKSNNGFVVERLFVCAERWRGTIAGILHRCNGCCTHPPQHHYAIDSNNITSGRSNLT